MPKKPPAQTYAVLVKSIQSQVFEARHKIERTAVAMYWTVGRSIAEYIKKNDSTLPNGRNIYIALSKDINIDARTLNQTVVFYRAYPKIKFDLPLSWSHYRYLSMIASEPERKKWERRTVREGLSVHRLQSLIQEKRNGARLKTASKLNVTHGKLYHYRSVQTHDIGTRRGRTMIDCGFKNRVAPPAGSPFINKYIYRAEKTTEGYTLKKTGERKEVIYTYVATVERVIDADTLLVNIDCGFGIYRQERLRLRGIDAPEGKTLRGRRAADWVKSVLAHCPFIVVKTTKEGKYGRYLADVFYLKGESDPQRIAEKGKFLNQELLGQGLAEKY